MNWVPGYGYPGIADNLVMWCEGESHFVYERTMMRSVVKFWGERMKWQTSEGTFSTNVERFVDGAEKKQVEVWLSCNLCTRVPGYLYSGTKSCMFRILTDRNKNRDRYPGIRAHNNCSVRMSVWTFQDHTEPAYGTTNCETFQIVRTNRSSSRECTLTVGSTILLSIFGGGFPSFKTFAQTSRWQNHSDLRLLSLCSRAFLSTNTGRTATPQNTPKNVSMSTRLTQNTKCYYSDLHNCTPLRNLAKCQVAVQNSRFCIGAYTAALACFGWYSDISGCNF